MTVAIRKTASNNPNWTVFRWEIGCAWECPQRGQISPCFFASFSDATRTSSTAWLTSSCVGSRTDPQPRQFDIGGFNSLALDETQSSTYRHQQRPRILQVPYKRRQ